MEGTKTIVLGVPDQGRECAALYAIIAVDKDGNEGICGKFMPGTNTMMPFVFQNWELVQRARPLAIEIKAVAAPGTRIVLVKFSERTDLETY